MTKTRKAAATRPQRRVSTVGQDVGLLGKSTQRALDVFTNALARTGDLTSSLENGTAYPLSRLTLSFWQLVALYEGSWIARRVVDAPAQDVVKTWPKIISEVSPKDLGKVDAVVRRTNTKGQITWGMQLGRLFGGAGALIVIKGHEHDLDQPLDLDDVPIGGYKGLSVFDRWSGIMPTGVDCEDIEKPLDVGLPEFYTVSSKGAASFKVHASRVLRFCGPRMPEPENGVYSDWGISVLAPVMQALKSYDNVSANALSLSFRANLIGMREETLSQLTSGAGISQAAAEQYAMRMSQINQSMSNQSLVVLGKDGELSNIQYSFGGLAELIQMFQLQLAGAAKMPVSLLWGRTYNGLGGAGDGDERIYEKTIATEADVTLRPAVEKLLPVICMSELGEVPDDLELNFPSIRVLDEKEKADLAKTVVDSVTVCINTGLFSPQVGAKEIKAAADVTGFGSNLTDEFIATLSDKTQAEGEGMGEGLFGESKAGVPALDPDGGPQKVLREEGEADREKQQPPAKAADLRGILSRIANKFGGAQARDADSPGPEIEVHGLPVVIENWKGECRHGSIELPYSYGYLKGYPGADGDSLDVCLGPNLQADWAYIVDQRHLPPAKGFDESKVMLGYESLDAAIRAFNAGHDRACLVFMNVTPMQIQDFKTWLKERDPKKPAGEVKA